MSTKVINRVPFESESWGLMSNMSFEQIVNFSNLLPKWKNWSYVKNNKAYKKAILKPVNMYVANFSEPPEVIKISDTQIYLRYSNYGDILIQIADPMMGHKGIFKSNPINSLLYATDKCWLRQFYPSSNVYNIDKINPMSDRVFKMFIPWFLDMDIKYTVKTNSENSSIVAIEKEDYFTKTNENVIIKEANFVDFYFTTSDKHMEDSICGLIKKGSYLFDIQIESDKKTIKRIIGEYEKKRTKG
jgi:hypothetical protein